MTDQQLMDLVEAMEGMIDKLLDDYLGLNNAEEELYSKKRK